MKTLDCRGLACPQPVIATKKELEQMAGGILEVLVDNEAAKANVSKFAGSVNAQYSVEGADGVYRIRITKGEGETVPKGIAAQPEPSATVIVLGSEVLGYGNDELGAALVKSYIYALTESDPKPSALLFLNGGVKLTTEGSDVLESLAVLEAAGAELLSCGTCLDFYGLKEKLRVGSITNMYTIVEKMSSASKVIRF